MKMKQWMNVSFSLIDEDGKKINKIKVNFRTDEAKTTRRVGSKI